MMFIVSQAQQFKQLSVALQFSIVVAKQHIENNLQYPVVYRKLQCKLSKLFFLVVQCLPPVFNITACLAERNRHLRIYFY